MEVLRMIIDDCFHLVSLVHAILESFFREESQRLNEAYINFQMNSDFNFNLPAEQ